MVGLYRPPVLKKSVLPSDPPQTIISLPVHTAECEYLAVGGLGALIKFQVSVSGLYLAPVTTAAAGTPGPNILCPPQMIISLPVHTAECPLRAAGALLVVVAVQLFVPGLYFAPVFKPDPPQMIISLPVHTAV